MRGRGFLKVSVCVAQAAVLDTGCANPAAPRSPQTGSQGCAPAVTCRQEAMQGSSHLQGWRVCLCGGGGERVWGAVGKNEQH